MESFNAASHRLDDGMLALIGALRTMADLHSSTLMYIEAEAKMDSFQAQDGTQRTALNLLQRMF